MNDRFSLEEINRILFALRTKPDQNIEQIQYFEKLRALVTLQMVEESNLNLNKTSKKIRNISVE
jgi:hypothetical protein